MDDFDSGVSPGDDCVCGFIELTIGVGNSNIDEDCHGFVLVGCCFNWEETVK